MICLLVSCLLRAGSLRPVGIARSEIMDGTQRLNGREKDGITEDVLLAKSA